MVPVAPAPRVFLKLGTTAHIASYPPPGLVGFDSKVMLPHGFRMTPSSRVRDRADSEMGQRKPIDATDNRAEVRWLHALVLRWNGNKPFKLVNRGFDSRPGYNVWGHSDGEWRNSSYPERLRIAHTAEDKRMLGRAYRPPLNPEPIGEEACGGVVSATARIRA